MIIFSGVNGMYKNANQLIATTLNHVGVNGAAAATYAQPFVNIHIVRTIGSILSVQYGFIHAHILPN
jgi:hypothetical protein